MKYFLKTTTIYSLKQYCQFPFYSVTICHFLVSALYFLSNYVLVAGIVLLGLLKRNSLYNIHKCNCYLCSLLSPDKHVKKTFFWDPIDTYFDFSPCLYTKPPLQYEMKYWYFPASYISLLRWNFTHSYTFFATLQSHLITMISTCSLQISWKPQSPWVKSKRLIHKAIQLAVNLEFMSLHLFSAHLLFLLPQSTKLPAAVTGATLNSGLRFYKLAT